MKKLLVLVLALMLCASAVAEIDLSGLSFDELVELRDSALRAMWDCEEWQEVTVPQGVWKVGEDIPFGHWTITPAKNAACEFSKITYCKVLDETGRNPKLGKGFLSIDLIYLPSKDYPGEQQSVDLDLQYEGYLIIDLGDVIFVPYTGHADLGFKAP